MTIWKKIQLWLCRNLGWHSPGAYTGFDGCSAQATCKHCGYQGLIDSQGNLF